MAGGARALRHETAPCGRFTAGKKRHSCRDDSGTPGYCINPEAKGICRLGTSARIFISYRRGDVPGDARGVCDRLERKFGKTNVFMDVDRLLAGQRFDRELDKALFQCDVLIAVIGPRWMELLSAHASSGERDFVHDEIAAALKRDIVVIPVLIGREGYMPSLPRRADLPEDIRELVQYQKHNIAHESFGRDADQLTAAIKSALRGARAPRNWRAIAIAGATGLALVAVLLGYETDIISRSGLVVITDCDRLAASPFDLTRPSGVVGIEFAKLEAASAKTACDDAILHYPDVARFSYQAGRAADKLNDYAGAVQLYQWAVSRGSAAAMYNLGNMYFDGRGVAADYAEGRKWYEQSARQGNAAALVGLGNLYLEGRGVAMDYTQARKLYEEAAARNNREAMNALGTLYQNGKGVAKDYTQARRWYEKAAALGSAVALANIGTLYENGQGVPENYALARVWYEKAAALGNADAAARLGKFFEKAQGVPKSIPQASEWYEKALEWYAKGAELGDPGAMNGLGVMYRDSQGVPQDYNRAREWFEKAAKLNESGAMTNLGNLYRDRKGVPQDYDLARTWYEKAKALGDADAMVNLGSLYEKGLGVPADTQQAGKLYREAADAAFGKARAKLAGPKS